MSAPSKTPPKWPAISSHLEVHPVALGPTHREWVSADPVPHVDHAQDGTRHRLFLLDHHRLEEARVRSYFTSLILPPVLYCRHICDSCFVALFADLRPGKAVDGPVDLAFCVPGYGARLPLPINTPRNLSYGVPASPGTL